MDSRARRNHQKTTCENCEFKTNSAAILKQHMKSCKKEIKPISKSKRIQCKKCEKKFNKEKTYNIHMKSVHNELITEDTIQRNTQEELLNNMKLTSHTRSQTLRSNKTLSSALNSNS